MGINLNFNDKLNFDEIDMTAPDKVIQEVLDQLPEETNGIVLGKVKEYNGPIVSYKRRAFTAIADALGTVEKDVDIQEDLGAFGEETHKFECYLYTSEFDKYKYRTFFFKYGIVNYPVQLVLDESISRSINRGHDRYIVTCDTRNELEELLETIFTSKHMIAVMQKLIRINQSKKAIEEIQEIDESSVEES